MIRIWWKDTRIGCWRLSCGYAPHRWGLAAELNFLFRSAYLQLGPSWASASYVWGEQTEEGA